MEAYADALGRYRGKEALYDSFRFFQAIKLALKDTGFEGTRVFGQYWSAESLAGLFLRNVKAMADRECGSGARIAAQSAAKIAADRAVIGRPVVLGSDPKEEEIVQERFRAACAFAGFSRVDFVLEPVGALLGSDLGGDGRVLVFDFGGGTLDISVAERSRDSLKLLAAGGMDLGGYALNEDLSRARIISHFGFGGKFRTMAGRYLDMPKWITDQVASFYALPLGEIAKTRRAIKELMVDARAADRPKLRGLLAFIDGNMGFDLFNRIDEAKIDLSERERSTISFAVEPYIRLAENITRRDFEAIIGVRVAEARQLIASTLEKAKLRPADIDAVVRVGGSSRIPAFIAMLEDLFPGRVSEGAVFTSIAQGLLEAHDRGFSIN
jgi:hypothetical chaperone protein